MKYFDCDLEVRYSDTDQMGIVHHAVHPIYFEQSRLQIFERLGLPYQRVEEAGYFLMVHKMSLRYMAPARFGQAIYVRGCISRLNKRLIEFSHEIRSRDDDQLICTGHTTHMVTRGTSTLVSLPEEFITTLKSALG